MLGSFDCTAALALDEGAAIRPESRSPLQARSGDRRRRAKQAFRAAIEDCPSFPRNQDLFNQLIEIFVREKTSCENCYQAATRSGWIHIPLAEFVEILDHGK